LRLCFAPRFTFGKVWAPALKKTPGGVLLFLANTIRGCAVMQG